MFLLLIGLITAAPTKKDAQLSTGTSLEIAYPKTPAFELNKNFTLHFHVYNSTGSIRHGNKINNCSIHIYNTQNSHIIQQNLLLDGIDYEIKLNSSTFPKAGTYAYLTQCDGINEDGFVSDSIIITNTGELTDTIGYLYGIAIFLVAFMFFIIYIVKHISDTNEHGEIIQIYTYLKMILIGIAAFTAFMLVLLSVSFAETAGLSVQILAPLNVLYNFILWSFIILGGLYLLGIMINIFYGAYLWAIKQLK